MRLKKKFFEQNTLRVARELLGKTLVRKWRGKELRGVITETEAYRGFSDKASHACLSGRQAYLSGRQVSRGITPRTALMFGEAGRAYVYLIYGIHHCLNIVTEKNGYPAAVLIRSIWLSDSQMTINGPGRICKFLHIDKTLNGEDIIKSRKLWIESNLAAQRPNKILRGPRIGIDYAGEWKDKPWRFYLAIGQPNRIKRKNKMLS
ncbi:MAG: DNA-3-methyladenine glycosylase [Patescibacteria group bacterium]